MPGFMRTMETLTKAHDCHGAPDPQHGVWRRRSVVACSTGKGVRDLSLRRCR